MTWCRSRKNPQSPWLYFELKEGFLSIEISRIVLGVLKLGLRTRLEVHVNDPGDLKLAGERRGVKFYYSQKTG